MTEPFAYWSSLRHSGMLISESRLTSAFPPSVEPLSEFRAERLRRVLQARQADTDGAGILDIVLCDLCGLDRLNWKAGASIGPEWSRRATTGEIVKPRRIWIGSHDATLPVFVDKETRLGVGRGRRSVARVVEWMRGANQKLAVITNFRQWRLIYAGLDFESSVEWDTDLWFAEGLPSPQVDALRILLSSESLTPHADGEQAKLLGAILDSRKGEAELSAALGERVRRAVELLIQGHAQSLDTMASDIPKQDIYRAATRMIMRLVVVLFAEARELLPLDNPLYLDSYSIKGIIHDLDCQKAGSGDRLRMRISAWPRLLSLFRLVYDGSPHEKLPVLRYGGGLFRPGDPSSSNLILRAVHVFEQTENCPSDGDVSSILELICQTTIKIRQGTANVNVKAPVDFSDLSSEYIGILYEGLLDFELRQADEPIIFLAIGDEPALPLERLRGMSDAALAQLVEKFKVKATKTSGGEAEEGAGDEEADEEAEVDDADEIAIEVPDELTETEARTENDERLRVKQEAVDWAVRAVKAGSLVPRPRGRNEAASRQYEADVSAGAKRLISRVILPGERYLVRWGGTRKGSGTFYTRPGLAVPTVIRTLLPLVCNPPIGENGLSDEYAKPSEWTPKPPSDIISLKVCDPSMGSASFLVSALRCLSKWLYDSLFLHGWLVEEDDFVKIGSPLEPVPAWLYECIKDLPLGDAETVIISRLKRLVVERCLYGVDLDALAVELGRLALWVETMDRDLPFEFLDHKLKCGNSLVGCWFDQFRDYPLMAWKRETGDKNYKRVNNVDENWTEALTHLRNNAVKNEIVSLITTQQSFDFTGATGKSPELIHKEAMAAYARVIDLNINEPFQRELDYEALAVDKDFLTIKEAFNVWCAIWFWPPSELNTAPLPVSFLKLTEDQVRVLGAVVSEYRFFHWELEFPDVFNSAASGFDAIIGNPPWETMKPNSKEFFSNIDPLYRSYGKQEALQKQREIFAADAKNEENWLLYGAHFKSLSNFVSHVMSPFGDGVDDGDKFTLARGKNHFHTDWAVKRSKRKGFSDRQHPYRYQGGGDINTYKMFLELSHALLTSGGQLGFIVPSGIYTDRGSTEFRKLFLDRCAWQWIFGFENREKVFDIDSRFKFCPIIIKKDSSTKFIRTAFMRRSLSDWTDAETFAARYPVENVRRFSPSSLSILEIRQEADLQLLEKIYANSVLLGDQSKNGWGVKYATEFHMTNDSKLFPPRQDWEAKGYVPDIYGRWVKPAAGKVIGHVVSEPGYIPLRGLDNCVFEDDIEHIALPLYEGRMIGQFDFSQKGWVSGKGRTAVWRDIPWEDKVIEPQYLMAQEHFTDQVDKDGEPTAIRGMKVSFMDVGSSTNSRTMFAAAVNDMPCGHKVPLLVVSRSPVTLSNLALLACLNSFVFDYQLRARFGGLSLSYYILAESAVPVPLLLPLSVSVISAKLAMPDSVFASNWLNVRATVSMDAFHQSWHALWACTIHERLRCRVMLDAIFAASYRMTAQDLSYVLMHSDYSCSEIGKPAFTRTLDPKGFWRIDKDKDPELRHTVLSLVAFHDLQAIIDRHGGDREAGIAEFCSLNDGEGWMLPETLCLADYGLGHDERAKHPQPVASRLGERFLPWQLEQTPEESWAECERHARNILGAEGFADLQAEIEAERLRRERGDAAPDLKSESKSDEQNTRPWLDSANLPDETGAEALAGETDLFGIPVQKDLFGEVVIRTTKKRR